MLYRRTANPSRRRIVRPAAETPVFHGTKRSPEPTASLRHAATFAALWRHTAGSLGPVALPTVRVSPARNTPPPARACRRRSAPRCRRTSKPGGTLTEPARACRIGATSERRDSGETKTVPERFRSAAAQLSSQATTQHRGPTDARQASGQPSRRRHREDSRGGTVFPRREAGAPSRHARAGVTAHRAFAARMRTTDAAG